MNNNEGSFFDTGFVSRLVDLPITCREKEILLHLAQGKTNKEISRDLILSPSTVRNHISSIFTKLKVSNRSQATRVAIYAGMLNESAVSGQVTETVS